MASGGGAMTRDEWRKELGRRSEEVAAAFLQKAGYCVVARNCNFRVGELDLVVSSGETLVVVEVRSASTSYLATPGITVNRTKQRKIVRATQVFLRRSGLGYMRLRFDVVAVQWKGGEASVQWFRDAFRPESSAQAVSFR